MKTVLATFAAMLVFLLGACGEDERDEPAPPAPQAAAPDGEPESAGQRDRAKPAGTEIIVSESQFGPILFDSDRQAIYLFDKETSEASECYGECAAAWPPVLTDGDPQAGRGIESKLLGTTARDDGSTQVTYAGHPLYYYAHEGPGQVLCHNVSEFGGLWLVIEPSGVAVS